MSDLKVQADELALDIKSIAEKIVSNTNGARKLKDEVTGMLNEIRIDILKMVDDKGKPVFSNETLRDSELQKRLSSREDIKSKSLLFEQLENTIAQDRINIEYKRNLLANMQKNWL